MKNIELLLYKLHLLCVFRPPLFNRQFQGFMDFSIKALYSPAYTSKRSYLLSNKNYRVFHLTAALPDGRLSR
ncbi:hypothetical protein U3516DRAFT_734894 [Neocallimastix sp. 'constans']